MASKTKQSVFKRTTLERKIYLLLSLAGAVVLFFFAYSFIKINKIDYHKNHLLNEKYPIVETISELNAGLNHTSVLLTAYLSRNKETEYKDRWQSFWDVDAEGYKEKLTNNEALKTNPKTRDLQRKLLMGVQNIETREKNIMNVVNQAESEQLIAEIGNSIDPLITQFNDDAILLESIIDNHIELEYSHMDKLISDYRYINYLFIILSAIILISAGVVFVRTDMRVKNELKHAIDILNAGDLVNEDTITLKDNEYIDESIDVLSEQLKNVKDFATKVGEGEFNNDISVFNNEGQVGTALAEMRNSLRHVAEEDKQRNWLNTGYAKFGDILRENNSNMTELCDVFVAELVQYLDANQGAIFLIDSDTQSEPVMQMKACYAYERRKKDNILIKKGEGLLGQSWQEKDTIFLTEIPDDYVKIKSGLGDANPNSLIVVPLIANEEVIGALEVASFNEFQPYHKEFIEKSSDNLGAAIGNTQSNERTHKLLENSQQMTEEMRAQEEEMRQNMEELEATQEEMQRAQTEMEKSETNMSALIDNTEDIIFAIDKEYTVTVANLAVKEFMKKDNIELKVGANTMNILSKKEIEYWKPRYDRALLGERFQEIAEFRGSQGKIQKMEIAYNPIMNSNGHVIGASIMSKDITALKESEENTTRKQSMLLSLLDDTEDTYFAVDKNYRVILFNKALEKRFKNDGVSIKEGDLLEEKIDSETFKRWKSMYDRGLSGESYSFTDTRPVDGEEITVEVFCNPLKDGENKIIGACILSRNISERIELEKQLQGLLSKQDT